MRKANGAGKAVGKIVTYLLIVLLVLGVAGAVFYFVAKQEGVSFYVEYDGTRYYSGINEGNLWLPAGDTYSFSVKSLTEGDVEYDVSVSSFGSNNFAFLLNGKYQQFYGTDEASNDYSEIFGLQKQADGFALTLPEGLTVEKVLEAKYGGDVQLIEEFQKDLPCFVISLVSGESRLSIGFSFEYALVLDSSSIVF